MRPDLTDPRTLELYSSAFTLSDMEVFLFPELMHALVLGNLLSPRIWAWREDPWFAGLGKLNFNRQLQRLKQYIMDHYTFNLDLETWGLTTKGRELARFSGFLDLDFLARSNALFGYEGDQYYYDQDIRRHFGLDRYTTDVIPYWKTETVEAMDAFRHKPGHVLGAGECVSLSALYAAALYIVLGIPLEDCFLMATPLHSQNFILRAEGVLTNNRRLVTKTNWFNGSELSDKARRALEKERVTIVSHISGWAHIEYPEATIDPEQYRRFHRVLTEFLVTPLSFEVFANFLRARPDYRRHFQFEFEHEGRKSYLAAETLYAYEHGSKFRVGDTTRAKLLAEVESEEFELQPLAGRIPLDLIERELDGKPLFCRNQDLCTRLQEWFHGVPAPETFCRDLQSFVCVQPRLPGEDKVHQTTPAISLPVGMTRPEIAEALSTLRPESRVADLAFYAHRQLDLAGLAPFLKAAIERNPVVVLRFAGQDEAAVAVELARLPEGSIYDEHGLATPDEVINFGRGEGLEKAMALAAVLKSRRPEEPLTLTSDGGTARVRSSLGEWTFPTHHPLVFSRML